MLSSGRLKAENDDDEYIFKTTNLTSQTSEETSRYVSTAGYDNFTKKKSIKII
jgi:hypothetical protein